MRCLSQTLTFIPAKFGGTLLQEKQNQQQKKTEKYKKDDLPFFETPFFLRNQKQKLTSI
jgi:hypothetical protein